MEHVKKSGGPGIFVHRLMDFMQEREMIRLVNKKSDIYFSTVWLTKTPSKTKIVYRAASAYYNTHEKKRNESLNFKLSKAIRFAHYVIYQSRFGRMLTKKILRRKGRHYKIIPNGFDLSPYRKIKPYIRGKQEKYLFVACADWTEKAKRGHLVIKAFRRAKITNSRLIMIGKPNLDLARNYRSVRWVGKIPIKQIVSYLKSKPVLVHLCYVEICPNAVVEALSYGCPVVCNNIGGTPELVGGDGIIASCDKKFKFIRHPVDLYNVEIAPIAEAMRTAAITNWNISRPDLSMEVCARSYLTAFEEALAV